MPKTIALIMKTTPEGLCNTACTECGKDMSPLTLKPGVYSKPIYKNCMRCRDRKRAGRSRNDKPSADNVP
jgi:hypothetical protein